MSQALGFYQEIIGLHILEKTNNRVLLTADKEEPILTLREVKHGRQAKDETSENYHLAFLLPARKYLAAIYIYAHKNEQLFVGAADHLTCESIYLSDPDGNVVELYVDRNPSEWMWDERFVAMDLIPLDSYELIRETSESWNGIPKNTIIGHVHVTVENIESSTEFYTKIFPYEVVNAYDEESIFLSTNKYHNHLALNTWSERSTCIKNGIGIRSFTIEMSAKNRLQTVRKLLDKGFLVQRKDGEYIVQDLTGYTIYF